MKKGQLSRNAAAAFLCGAGYGDGVLISFFKLEFIALMPSPLGRVAEHSEDGRGTVK